MMLSPKNMVFRLPTHLESFVPPPSDQVPISQSWSGVLTLTFSSSSLSGHKDIYITAAETDGDKYVRLVIVLLKRS